MSTAFAIPVRVYYEDTDAGGVVYYANYLKFMERARTEWLRAIGFEQDHLSRELGVVFAVRTIVLDYLKPARFNDTLEVSVSMSRRGKASLTFAQTVSRTGETLCQGEVKIACVDSNSFAPRRIPDAMATQLEGLSKL